MKRVKTQGIRIRKAAGWRRPGRTSAPYVRVKVLSFPMQAMDEIQHLSAEPKLSVLSFEIN